jgi:MFS family permease
MTGPNRHHPSTARRTCYGGWNIVAGATLITLLTVGMRMGIGPFFLPMSADLGIGRSSLASIIAGGMLCYGLAMPAAGALIARRGTRFVLLLGTAIVALGLIWTANATTATEVFIAYGVLLSIGLGFTSPVALTPVISRWFSRQRGMALFFLSTGSMAGIAVMTPVFAWAIARWGWRGTLLAFCALFATVTVPIAIRIIRDDAPEDTDWLPGQSGTTNPANPTNPTHSAPLEAAPPHASMRALQAMRTIPFWRIVAGLFACGFSMNLLGTHGVPMLMDHGFDAMTSSSGIGLIGLVAIGSTVLMGRISDRLPRRYLLAAIYLVRGIGFFVLVAVDAKWELYLAATLGGLAWAGSIALSSAVLADLYGVRLVGILYGWAYLGHQIGATASAWLGGWGYEHWASHWPAFGLSGVLLLAATLVSLGLPGTRPARP